MDQPTAEEECLALRRMQKGQMQGLETMTHWHYRGVQMAAGSQGLWPQNVEEVANDVFIKFFVFRRPLLKTIVLITSRTRGSVHTTFSVTTSRCLTTELGSE